MNNITNSNIFKTISGYVINHKLITGVLAVVVIGGGGALIVNSSLSKSPQHIANKINYKWEGTETKYNSADRSIENVGTAHIVENDKKTNEQEVKMYEAIAYQVADKTKFDKDKLKTLFDNPDYNTNPYQLLSALTDENTSGLYTIGSVPDINFYDHMDKINITTNNLKDYQNGEIYITTIEDQSSVPAFKKITIKSKIKGLKPLKKGKQINPKDFTLEFDKSSYKDAYNKAFDKAYKKEADYYKENHMSDKELKEQAINDVTHRYAQSDYFVDKDNYTYISYKGKKYKLNKNRIVSRVDKSIYGSSMINIAVNKAKINKTDYGLNPHKNIKVKTINL